MSRDGVKYQVLRKANLTFLKGGQDWWRGAGVGKDASVYADRWVRYTYRIGYNNWRLADQFLNDAGSHASQVSTHQITAGPGGYGVQVQDTVIQLGLTTSGGIHVVHVAFRPGYQDDGGLSEVTVDLSYPRQLIVALPDAAADPGNPSTLPALYAVQRSHLERCDSSGCTVNATVTNTRGQSDKQATLIVHFTVQGGAEIASCTSPIPPLAIHQVADVPCTVSGPAWNSYLEQQPPTPFFYLSTVHNPVYDD
jgi:hypothetical protein